MKKIALILAGGSGYRLWPKSTKEKPKYLLNFFSDKTMIERIFKNIHKSKNFDDIFIICFEENKNTIKQLVPEFKDENIISEPFGRNTGIAIIHAVIYLKTLFEEDFILTIFPSDQIIKDEEKFIENLRDLTAISSIINGIISLGIKPLRPSNQLGYIQIEENSISQIENEKIYKAIVFAEKPDKMTAIRFIESGDFVWNTGIITSKLSVLEQELQKYLNFEFKQLERISEDYQKEEIRDIYSKINSVSIDNGLLEKTENLYVYMGDFDWTDMATWDEYYRQSKKDENNNVLEGDIYSTEIKDNLIIADSLEVGIVGVEGIIVVEYNGKLLICKKEESEKIMELLNYIKK